MENIKRIPRPIGLTLMAKQLNNTQEPEDYKKQKREMQEYIIKLYLRQGFRINQQEITLEHLSQYTQLSTKEILYKLAHYKGNYIEIQEKEDLNKAASIALMTLFENTFKTHNQIQENLVNLIKSKDSIIEKVKDGEFYEEEYKGIGKSPQAALMMAQREEFEAMAKAGYIRPIQPDINAALNLSLNATKGMERLVRLMSELAGTLKQGPGTIINNQLNQTNQTDVKVLTVDKAYELLAKNKEEGALLTEAQKLELGAQYLVDIPEVNAKYQTGYKAPNTVSDKARISKHETRRQDEVGDTLLDENS